MPQLWHNYDERIEIRLPASSVALKHIESSLVGNHYLDCLVQVAGTGAAVFPGDQPIIQLQLARIDIPIQPSASDWITKVFEPIGWGRYHHMLLPVPHPPTEALYKDAIAEMQKADDQFLKGADAPVFLHSYNALDPYFYSKRSEILEAIAGADQTKRTAIDDVLKAIHRFANGGRHRPEERGTKGGFEVDHIDADYVRGVTELTATYLAQRIEANRRLI